MALLGQLKRGNDCRRRSWEASGRKREWTRVRFVSFYSVVFLLCNKIAAIEFGVETGGVHTTTQDLFWHVLEVTQEALGILHVV